MTSDVWTQFMFPVWKVTPVHAHSFSSKRYKLFEMWDRGWRTKKQRIFCGAGNQVNFTSVVTKLQARQPRNYDFIPDKDKRFLVSPKCPGQLHGPPSLLFSMHQGLFSEGLMVTTHPYNAKVSHSLIRLNGLHRSSFVLLYLFVNLVWEGER